MVSLDWFKIWIFWSFTWINCMSIVFFWFKWLWFYHHSASKLVKIDDLIGRATSNLPQKTFVDFDGIAMNLLFRSEKWGSDKPDGELWIVNYTADSFIGHVDREWLHWCMYQPWLTHITSLSSVIEPDRFMYQPFFDLCVDLGQASFLVDI